MPLIHTPMTTSETPEERTRKMGEKLVKLLFLSGFGLVGYGSYMHFTMGDRTLGNCLKNNACNSWGPQWVIAPLVIGAVFVLLSGYFAYRR